MIYNFVETYQGIFEGGNRENREVWCCSKGGGGDDEIQPVKESIIETPEPPAETEPVKVCGDGKCDDTETCKTCVEDCGCKGDLVCDNGKCVKAGEKGNPCRKVGNECDEELVCEKEVCKDKREEVKSTASKKEIEKAVNRKNMGGTKSEVKIDYLELKNTGNTPITIIEVSLTGECKKSFIGVENGETDTIDESCTISNINVNPNGNLKITSSECSWFGGFKTKECGGWFGGWKCSGTLDWGYGSTKIDLSC